MTLIPEGYRPRLIDASLERLLAAAPAVLLEGPKWCGKTWTGLRAANSVAWIADPAQNYLTRRLAETNPSTVIQGDTPRLIDEWQDAPGLWDAVRHEADHTPGAGRFILTGSATPQDGAVSHTGTGRIARLSMWPMSLIESGDAPGGISLRQLFDSQPPPTLTGTIDRDTIAELVCRGGWPATIGQPVTITQTLTRSYVDSIAYIEVPQVVQSRRD
ncbi:MAG: AAA family ATPase, partial [Propionibacteriaceae bacterium]|nr:AAA family ATPase [Propionibacteriaceae bacterium]